MSHPIFESREHAIHYYEKALRNVREQIKAIDGGKNRDKLMELLKEYAVLKETLNFNIRELVKEQKRIPEVL